MQTITGTSDELQRLKGLQVYTYHSPATIPCHRSFFIKKQQQTKSGIQHVSCSHFEIIVLSVLIIMSPRSMFITSVKCY